MLYVLSLPKLTMLRLDLVILAETLLRVRPRTRTAMQQLVQLCGCGHKAMRMHAVGGRSGRSETVYSLQAMVTSRVPAAVQG